jgi:hypothetical protein
MRAKAQQSKKVFRRLVKMCKASGLRPSLVFGVEVAGRGKKVYCHCKLWTEALSLMYGL